MRRLASGIPEDPVRGAKEVGGEPHLNHEVEDAPLLLGPVVDPKPSLVIPPTPGNSSKRYPEGCVLFLAERAKAIKPIPRPPLDLNPHSGNDSLDVERRQHPVPHVRDRAHRHP